MNKTITIVTPSLNQGQFLEQTIKSVILQKGDFFIDYIVADGGSSDNSVRLIKKYDNLIKSGEFPINCKGVNYRWWSKKDKGQSNAINRGFKLARGDVLAWINSDDYYEPDAFAFVLKRFKEEKKIDLLYGDGYRIMGKRGVREIKKSEPGTFEIFLKRGHVICQSSAFFTKSIFNKVGLLDEDLHYSMDFDLWLKIMKQGRAAYVPRILSTYRLWYKSKSIAEKKRFLKDHDKIYKKYGVKPLIKPEIVYALVYRIPFLSFIKKRFPGFYKNCKRVVNFFVDRMYFKRRG